MGFLPDTKIIIGSSDGCLATLGAGVWGEGKATITIEESGAVRVVGKKVLQDEKQRFFNYLLTEGIMYLADQPTMAVLYLNGLPNNLAILKEPLIWKIVWRI